MIQIGFLAYTNRKASARSVEREQKRERKKNKESYRQSTIEKQLVNECIWFVSHSYLLLLSTILSIIDLSLVLSCFVASYCLIHLVVHLWLEIECVKSNTAIYETKQKWHDYSNW